MKKALELVIENQDFIVLLPKNIVRDSMRVHAREREREREIKAHQRLLYNKTSCFLILLSD